MSNKPNTKKKGGRTTPPPRSVQAQVQQQVLDAAIEQVMAEQEPNFRKQEESIRTQWSAVADHEAFEEFVDTVMTNTRRGVVCRIKGADLEPVSMLTQRLERVLNKVMPIGTPERLEFELEWQRAISVSYDGLEEAVAEHERQQATRGKLLLPADQRTNGGLVLPGQ